MILLRVLQPLKKPLRKWIENRSAKYDLGENQDPIHSFGDLLTRYLYARLHQKESFKLPRQVARQYQYQWVTLLFHLRRLIRKSISGYIPVRVVFLAGCPLDWGSLESLYHACKINNNFRVYVVNVGWEWMGMGTHTDCSKRFNLEGIAYHDGISRRVRLDLLYPDIIVTSSPYDSQRPRWYETRELLRYAKLVYIPYGIDFSDASQVMSKQIFGFPTQKHAWRIFTRSPETLESYQKYANKSKDSVIPLGLPVMDQYYSQSIESLPADLIERAKDKFKIIYSPHYTIDGWSTFLDFAEHIRDYIDQNDDCFLIFRPHPNLVDKLVHHNIMSANEFRHFFSGKRVYLYEGINFNSIFRYSDMLLSDASSFLVQYAPTRNPIVYIEKENGWGLDASIAESVKNSCYIARSENDITYYIDQIKAGLDPIRIQRIQSQESICRGIFSGDAGKRIANYLSEELHINNLVFASSLVYFSGEVVKNSNSNLNLNQKLKPDIKFFCVSEEEILIMSPIANLALERGYKVSIERDMTSPAVVGFYCYHYPNPSNSRFSLVMLHDLGQEYWPSDMTTEENHWKESDWSGFDIAFLPGAVWSECWRRFKTLSRANPRIGVYEVGWPKSDEIFNQQGTFWRRSEDLRKELNLEQKPTILFATSWETQDLRNLRCYLDAVKNLNVNVLVKYWPGFYSHDAERLCEDTGAYLIKPEVNILACLSLSDLIVSDESNCMVEALIFNIPSIGVTDWSAPALPSWGPWGLPLPERPCIPPAFSIKTDSVSLENTVVEVLNKLPTYKKNYERFKNEWFVNFGNSAEITMNTFEACYFGNNRPQQYLIY